VEQEYHTTQHSKLPAQSQPGKTLSERHRREIVEGSGVNPAIAESRYFSVTAEEATELGFSRCQARAGWVAELLSPSGEASYVLKPDMPRCDDRGRVVKYEIRAAHPMVIDVGDPVRALRVVHHDTDGKLEELWVTEGAKKADALATHGRLAINLSGVWNWGKKRKRGGAKYGRPELLPDWKDVPLEGRRVYLAFDSDYREKPNVALAMMRLAERLTERGAHVFIACPPGPEKGIDDYLVAGGDIAALETSAAPFDPTDFIPYVSADRSQRVHKIVASQIARMRLDDWTGRGDKSPHSLLRALLELALERGRYSREEDAVVVVATSRELQQRASIGSRNTVARADATLTERGYYEKVSGCRVTGKANSYRMKFAEGVPLIGERGGENPKVPITGTVSENFVSHLRWSAPVALESKDGPESKIPPPDATPENPLRHKPTIPSIYAGDAPQVLERQGLEAALGKVLELALWSLLQWGGRSTIRDLSGVAGVNDTSKMRKRLEDLQGAGVVEMDEKGKHHAEVWLTENWRERLRERREVAGEFARARQQAVKHHNARVEYHNPDAHFAEDAPPLLGPEAVAEALARNRENEKRRWIAEQRQKVGMTAATFLADELEGISGTRFTELRRRLLQKGGAVEELRRAVLYGPWEFKREHDGDLYVYWEGAEPAEYIGPNESLWRERQQEHEEDAQGPEQHPWHCGCPECGPEHRYATPNASGDWGA
jgi:hypothetical protein